MTHDKYFFAKTVSGKKVTIPLDETNEFWCSGLTPMQVIGREESESVILPPDGSSMCRIIADGEGKMIFVYKQDGFYHITPQFDDFDAEYSFFIFRNLFRRKGYNFCFYGDTSYTDAIETKIASHDYSCLPSFIKKEGILSVSPSRRGSGEWNGIWVGKSLV